MGVQNFSKFKTQKHKKVFKIHQNLSSDEYSIIRQHLLGNGCNKECIRTQDKILNLLFNNIHNSTTTTIKVAVI
uniref:Uncharacterized protein n=1 Tax=Glossina brevipalpis TaxID=37001 RepID=A0A1A9WDU5_9MUSC